MGSALQVLPWCPALQRGWWAVLWLLVVIISLSPTESSLPLPSLACGFLSLEKHLESTLSRSLRCHPAGPGACPWCSHLGISRATEGPQAHSDTWGGSGWRSFNNVYERPTLSRTSGHTKCHSVKEADSLAGPPLYSESQTVTLDIIHRSHLPSIPGDALIPFGTHGGSLAHCVRDAGGQDHLPK